MLTALADEDQTRVGAAKKSRSCSRPLVSAVASPPRVTLTGCGQIRPAGAHPPHPLHGRRGRSPAVPRTRVAATTIQAISDLSDTPQPTVYQLFSSKLGILKAVLDISIDGDDEAVAMVDRPQVRALVTQPDPHDTLTRFAALVGELMVRTAPVHRVLEEAARSDQDAAAALAQIALQRHDAQRRASRAHSRGPARCDRGSPSVTRPT